MASWHDAQRMYLENFHGQSSLLDDPPVLIRATSLPVCDRSPSEVRGTNGFGAPATGSSFHDKAVSAQDLSLARALTAKGV